MTWVVGRRFDGHLPGVPKRLVLGFALWACAGLSAVDLLLPHAAPVPKSAPKLADLMPHVWPETPPAPASSGRATQTFVARAGDTLSSLLRRAGLQRDEAEEAVAAIAQRFDPKRLKVGQDVRLTFVSHAPQGEGLSFSDRLVNVSVRTDADRQIEALRRADGAYEVRELIQPLAVRPTVTRGTIHGSLFESATASGLPVKIVMEMIRIFSYQVDFQRDIQDGDSYEVMFDRHFDDQGKAVKEGDVTYARLTLSGRSFELYRYTPDDTGEADYFDGQGRSVQRALKRTPIDGARLTSAFGMRNHPILGYTRMHRGVDFAAPTGTPIQAAGAGVVEFAGTHAGHGLYVRLGHDDKIDTAYGHMSKLAAGIKPGRRVRQGEIIGYVGQSGLATGPHLHYEVMVANQQVNPAKVALPTGRTLTGSAMAAFQSTLHQVQSAKASLPANGGTATNLASTAE